jgi:hypothetical protein
VVERGGLENRCSACGTESSNLSLSAIKKPLLSGFLNSDLGILILQLILLLMIQEVAGYNLYCERLNLNRVQQRNNYT